MEAGTGGKPPILAMWASARKHRGAEGVRVSGLLNLLDRRRGI